jgi:hypothetical protein
VDDQGLGAVLAVLGAVLAVLGAVLVVGLVRAWFHRRRGGLDLVEDL